MIYYKKIMLALGSFLLAGVLSGAVVHAQKTAIKPIGNEINQGNYEIEGEKYARSTVDRLNVRTHPDLTSSVLLMIGKTNRFEIIDEEVEWIKIKLSDERSGWVFREYIDYEYSNEAVNTNLNQETVVHIVDVTNLRSGPGTDYNIVSKAMPGDIYPIVEAEGDWYIVELPNKSKVYVASWVVETDFLSRNANIVTSLNKEDAEFAPQLYIYHTHNKESWSNVARNTKGNSVDDPYTNITLVGKHLAQLLNEKNIPTLTGNNDFSEELRKQKLGFSDSYKVSRQAVNKVRETYPSLSYFFDIHRDSDIPRERTTVTIEGKVYARILFVIGTAHSDYKKNLAFAEAMNKLINEKYPGLSRGIITKNSRQGDGEYNQSVSSGSLLLEIGGTNNTLQENLHTAEAIADVFAEYEKLNK